MNNCPARSTAPAATACDTSAVVPSRDGWPVSHLHAAEHTFTLLTTGDDPKLTLDAETELPAGLGLPGGRRSLAWWREWLLANRTSYDARNAIWAYVIGRARTEGGDWKIAAAGLAMPKLLRYARDLARVYRGEETELHCELLTNFLRELRRVNTAAPGADTRLTRAAYRAGKDEVERLAEQAPPTPDADNAPSSRPPLLPYQHVDLLVAQAVKLGLLDRDDAAAFVAIKLAHRPDEPVAARLGVTADCLRMRLDAAGKVLAEALAAGFLSGPVVISPAARKKLERLRAIREQARQGRATTMISTRMNAAMPVPAMAR